MADRNLTRTRDFYATSDGPYSELRIERSAAGQPGLLFIIETYEEGALESDACVSVQDGNTVLAPVLSWLGQSAAADDRQAAAREALSEWDRPTRDIIGDDGFPLIGTVERAEWVIRVLRTLVEPAANR